MAAAEVAAARRELALRLKRVEGQVRAVAGMVEAGADCEATAQQLAAARTAHDRAFYELMACALEHPQFSAQPGERTDARVRRLTRTLARLG
ncbi:MAG: metal-sensitive transcriptional regulator [Betaproteobacteria bacterium]